MVTKKKKLDKIHKQEQLEEKIFLFLNKLSSESHDEGCRIIAESQFRGLAKWASKLINK